jgi:hypothetical protein
MTDIGRANRRLERMLPGLQTNEPPDDRKTFEDMLRYPRHDLSAVGVGERIATIVMLPNWDIDYVFDKPRRDVSGEVADLDRKFTGMVRAPGYNLNDKTYGALTYYFFKSRTLMQWAAASMDTKGYFAASQLNFQLRAQLGLPLMES